jgi:DDE superfamily endonuclease
VAVDATAFPIQRPLDTEKQRGNYSGKHKGHAVKATVLACIATSFIPYVGRLFPGSVHDFRMFREEFGGRLGYFDGLLALFDAGYTGMKKLLGDAGVGVLLGVTRKKPKGGELEDWERAYNSAVGSLRVRAEHAIRGIKRYRIFTVKSCFRDMRFFDRMVGVGAGLWNFKILRRLGKLRPLTT